MTSPVIPPRWPKPHQGTPGPCSLQLQPSCPTDIGAKHLGNTPGPYHLDYRWIYGGTPSSECPGTSQLTPALAPATPQEQPLHKVPWEPPAHALPCFRYPVHGVPWDNMTFIHFSFSSALCAKSSGTLPSPSHCQFAPTSACKNKDQG